MPMALARYDYYVYANLFLSKFSSFL